MNKNILGHNFEQIDQDSDTVRFICNKCNCDIDYFTIDNEIQMWSSEYTDYLDLISCNEYIIKNILE